MRRLLLTLSLLPLTACATLTADSDQLVRIETVPEGGAMCSVHNGVGNWRTEPTPSTISIEREHSPLNIRCNKAGFGYGEATVYSSIRGRAWGNVALAGVPAVVDAATGDGYEYPSVITVPIDPNGSHVDINK